MISDDGHDKTLSLIASCPQLIMAFWLGREDSNLRMPVPKTGALPLGYAPVSDSMLKERKSGSTT